MSEAIDPIVGTLALGRYRIIQPLARGGMGMIYLARLEGAAGFSKPVVIKQVLSHLDGYHEARTQFIREARILSELHHPGIVGVLDFGEESDAYVMVLEYVHGFHLGQWLNYIKRTRKQMKPEFAVYAILRVLEAVHYAHTRVDNEGKARVIIHRDISPGNILIDLQGNVRLLDFGIARAVGDKGEFQTREGVVKGKLSYIAPEVYGSVEAGPGSDVYALGVVLYQLLAGKNPFVGKDMSDTIGRVLKGQSPSLSSLRSDLPEDLCQVIATAMAKDPELRFATAEEFTEQLTATLKRSQSDIAIDFRSTVSRDFSTKLPQVLGLAPLTALDSAWRDSAADITVERSLLQSSLPPGTEEGSDPVLVPPHEPINSDLQTVITSTARTTAAHSEDTVATTPQRPEPKSSGLKIVLISMLGASVIAAGVAALVLSMTDKSQSTSDKPRYLLVERPEVRDAGSPPEKPPEVAKPTVPPPVQPKNAEEPADPPSSNSPPVESGSKKGASSAGFTQAFAKRAGAVQNCFARNTGDIQGSPKISVRFQLTASGTVNSASLSPSALASTSVGQCLLGVAGSTKFPEGKAGVAFSIPITARVVKN